MASSSASTTSLRPRRRRTSSTAAESLSTVAEHVLSAAKQVEDAVARTTLLLWDDLPTWRRDNAFLTSGYRPASNSITRSLASIASVHNETVNIWSHLLGAVFFLWGWVVLLRAVASRYASASAADVLVFSCFLGGAVLCLGMSAVYHTLSNHSETVALWGNKLDYSGIIILIVGSFIAPLYYGFFCHPVLMTFYSSMV